MGFTTETFLFIFMPISILVYVCLSRLQKIRVNNTLLIVLNVAFYAWSGLDTLFIFVLLSIMVYLIGSLICFARKSNEKTYRNWIYLAIGLLLTILFYYKYISFVAEQINSISNISISLKIVTPIGISFVIFEAVSYIVDIYRGDAESGSYFDLLLFLSFFPKIVSGPIVLWKDFNSQIYTREISITKINTGINRIIIGLSKKAIIADTFGAHIQTIERGITSTGVDTPTMWLRAILYFFQIYYDFSGYSDIAIGLCNIFGFSVKDNFNYPYISQSISEFWRRWHISLGSWFREYVYIPLGGNRKGNVYVHLFIVFLLTGIWHGANWTFVLWGGVNGLLVVFERFIKDKAWYKCIPSGIKWLSTVAIVFFLWILFMSPNIEEALKTYVAMFSISAEGINFTWKYYLTKKMIILLVVAFVGSIIGGQNTFQRKCNKFKATLVGETIHKLMYLILFIIAILFIVNSSYSPFLYFQF